MSVTKLVSYAYKRGNPTRLAPKPKPAPCLAVRPMLGANRSNRAKVTAATMEQAKISSTFNFFWGMMNMANATARPSKKYLMARVTSSVIVKPSILIIRVPKFFLSRGFDQTYSIDLKLG